MNEVFCTESDNDVEVKPLTEEEILTLDFTRQRSPEQQALYNKQFNQSISVPLDKTAFFGFGTPFDMTKPSDPRYGFNQWAIAQAASTETVLSKNIVELDDNASTSSSSSSAQSDTGSYSDEQIPEPSLLLSSYTRLLATCKDYQEVFTFSMRYVNDNIPPDLWASTEEAFRDNNCSIHQYIADCCAIRTETEKDRLAQAMLQAALTTYNVVLLTDVDVFSPKVEETFFSTFALLTKK